MKRPRHTKRRKAAERSASSSSASEAVRTDFMTTLPAVAKKARETVMAWLRRAIALARKLRPHAAKARETVGTWWIACTSTLREYARSALEKLRTRFPMLDVYARALRLHAARLLASVGRGYRAGVAAIGRYSPRTAKAVVACETWLRQSDWRRLGLTGLAVVLVLGIGFAAIFPEAAGRYGRVIFTSSRIVPLPDVTRRAVREKAKELAAALDRRLDRKRKLAGETWPSAQILVALRENDPDYASRIDVKLVEQYFRSVAGPECACWRRFPQGNHPNHLGVTSWVLWTFAQYGIPAHKGELEFLLSAQGADGGWPLFAGAEQEKFASSYGTAAAILALHEQSALQSDREQKKRLAAAVRRGARALGGLSGVAGGPAGLPGGFGFRAFRAASRGRLVARLARPRLAARASCASARRAEKRSIGEGGSGRQPVLPRRDALLRASLDDSRDGGGLPERVDFQKSPRSAVARARACARGFDLRAHRARKKRGDRRRSAARPAERSEA